MIKQGSQEWFELRRGKFTSSNIHKLLGKSINTEVAKTYILTKLSERLGVQYEEASAKSLDWGNENESLAFKLIDMLITPIKVCGFRLHQEFSFLGGSSDGYNNDLEVEIKCPYNTAIHIKHLQVIDNKSMLKVCKDYYAQLQTNMLINNKEKGLFVSFDPRLKHDKGLHYCYITKDETFQNLILERVQEAELYLSEFESKYITNK